ncbi:MAG: tRNA (adenosine(37)-N6)-dimethylallyltransferase MiaA, partial [Phycisphaerales bacterium]|nr:tRNA (adenosine(37)-N6)-dimethylallyltransferase MiaA [Phycisphaerales bacterium]
VYRGMDIGTAKPTDDERAGIPHHLIDLVDPADDGFTVDTWLEAENEVIERLRAASTWPIVVGGTNLYIQALLYGLFDGPEPDPALRAELQALPIETLRAELARCDPEAASRIHTNDRRRTVRAVEVFRITGRPISAWQQQWSLDQIRRDIRVIGLDYTPAVINRRINARVRAMIEAGWLEEVRRLLAGPPMGSQARAALGYRELIDHLEGRETLDEAIELIKIRTRRLGKQQRTWLRRFRPLSCSIWISADELDHNDIVSQALTSLGHGG